MTGRSKLEERDQRVSWHPYTQHGVEKEFLPVARAQGASLFLEDGRELLDAISSWWAILHGHGNADLTRAITAQMETLDHVLFAGATHEPAVACAEADDVHACRLHLTGFLCDSHCGRRRNP